MKACAAIMITRRSKPSANAPAISANITIGSVVDACTRATISADAVIDSIIQDAPTPWINPPNCEPRFAIQTLRKIACLNGASVEGETPRAKLGSSLAGSLIRRFCLSAAVHSDQTQGPQSGARCTRRQSTCKSLYQFLAQPHLLIRALEVASPTGRKVHDARVLTRPSCNLPLCALPHTVGNK